MTNKLITLFFIVLLVSCFSVSKKNKLSRPDYYRVAKLDSINNYYIIKAVRNDSVFNIVSKKEKEKKCLNKILEGKTYTLNLRSIFKDVQPIILKNNLYHITSWAIDDSLSVRIDSLRYYYTTENFQGLCEKSIQ